MAEESGKRLPPQDREAEEALLGSLLINNDAMLDVVSDLKPDYFYGGRTGKHGAIYAAMLALDVADTPIDILTLTSKLTKFSDNGEGSIEAYLLGLVETVPTSLNAKTYARIIQDRYVRRKVIRDAQSAANMAYDEKEPLDQILLKVATKHQVTTGVISDDAVSMGDLCQRILDTVLGDVPPPRIFETEFLDIDRVLDGGFRAGDYVCIAARPSMGKTAFMMRVAINLAVKGNSVGVYSQEMLPIDLVARMVSMYTGIGTKRVMSSNLDEHQQQEVFAALDTINKLPIQFLDIGDQTVPSLRAACSKMLTTHGLDVLMVDYLQLMKGTGRNRVEAVTDVSNSLKALALELRIPVVVLSQLSRAVENRSDKRPGLADLRDSGSIEQDSDIVMFIYRDDYYNPDSSSRPNVAEINIAKHRNGPTGIADLYWMATRADFKNLTRQEISL